VPIEHAKILTLDRLSGVAKLSDLWRIFGSLDFVCSSRYIEDQIFKHSWPAQCCRRKSNEIILLPAFMELFAVNCTAKFALLC
jgi:hypothetical protein